DYRPAARPVPERRPAPPEAAPAAPPASYPGLFSQPALKRRAPRPDEPGHNTPSNTLLGDDSEPGETATVAAPIVSLAASPALRRVEAVWPRFVQAVKR